MSPFRIMRTALLILALALSACEGSEARESHYMERGVELFEEGKLNKAELEFKNVLQINPKNADAMYYMGRIAEARRDIRRAIRIYQSVLDEQKTHVGSNVRLGRFSLVAGEAQIALDHAEVALERDAENVDALAIKGSALMRQNRFDDARETLKKAILIDPQNETAQAAYVGLHRMEGSRAAAYKAAENAIEASPESISLRLLLVGLLVEDGARSEVAATFQEIFELADNPAPYHSRLARMYIEWDLQDKAIEQYRAALDADPENHAVRAALVDYLSKTKGVAEAEAELKSYVKKKDNAPNAMFQLAAFYERQGLFEEAFDTLNEIAESDGLSEKQAADAQSKLAALAIQQNDFEAAQTYVDRALEISPSAPDALTIRARLKIKSGDYDGAIQDLRNVLKALPQAAEPKRLIAEAHEKQGELELAADYLATLLDDKPGDHRARLDLVELLLKQGMHELALGNVDRVLDARPGSLRAIALKSEILSALGDFEQAQYLAAQLRLDNRTKPLAERLLGKISLTQENYEEAYKHLLNAAEMSPDNFGVINDLAWTLVLLDRSDEATQRLRNYSSAHPQDPRPYNATGRVMTAIDRIEDAKEEFSKAIAINPAWTVPRLNLAQIYVSRNAWDMAESVIREGLEHAPQSTTLLYTLGSVYTQQKQYEKAAEAFEEAYANNPRHFPSANNAAAIYSDYFYDDPEKIERALRLVDDLSARQEPEVLDTIGWVHYRNGDFNRAIAYLERALEAAPDRPAVQLHLGLAYYRTGNFEEARPLLESVSNNSTLMAQHERIPVILEELAQEQAKE